MGYLTFIPLRWPLQATERITETPFEPRKKRLIAVPMESLLIGSPVLVLFVLSPLQILPAIRLSLLWPTLPDGVDWPISIGSAAAFGCILSMGLGHVGLFNRRWIGWILTALLLAVGSWFMIAEPMI